MIRCLLFSVLVIFLGACSSIEPISYYQLDGGEFVPNKLGNEARANIIVSSPKLIGHLANRGIAVEVTPLQIQSANNHLWSSVPSELLLQASIVSLDNKLNDMRVIPLQLESAINAQLPTYRIDYYLNKFQATLNGEGIIAGVITVYKLEHTMANIVYSQGFTEQVKLKEDGYPALVSALNTAWLKTNQAVANEIKGLVDKD
ncbi:membrane integrity-associated transporter subunit PqiC [Pseudoalteromonas sp.]|uniref:PqiC family protein n=1 Tax=Pseudoalteromonas sp. TaxID=53249 RepID=UPI003562C493